METFALLNLKGLFIGNLFASLIGLIFVIGAPTSNEKKQQKYLWSLYWLSIFINTLTNPNIIGKITSFKLLFSILIIQDLAFIIASIALSLLLYCHYRTKKNKQKKVILITVIVASVPSLVQIILLYLPAPRNIAFIFDMTDICNNCFRVFLLMLIAWEARKIDITAALIFVAYATTYVISSLYSFVGDEQQFINSNLKVSLLLKFALIGAIYKIMKISNEK